MGDVTIEFRLPDARLRPLISSYYEMRFEGPGVIEDSLHPEWANIRLSLDQPWAMGASAETARVPESPLIIHGPTSKPTYVRGVEGRVFGIGILPPGWSRLWQADAAVFANSFAPLSSLVGAGATVLEARLKAAPDLDARAVIADGYLLDLLANARKSKLSDQVDALYLALADPDCATVEQIVSDHGISPARLVRLCKRAFGFPPKLLLRRQRFLRMLGALHARPYGEWRDFIDPQYVDQSHMLRDFRYFLNMSPGRYFATARPLLAAATRARGAAIGQPLQGLHETGGEANS
jgi:AraC-like DNA-binding protein